MQAAHPLLRFAILGTLLFAAQQGLQWRQSYTVIAPSADEIRVRYAQWSRMYGRPPDAQTQLHIHQEEIDQRILVQEALRRRYHRNDDVIEQRLLRDARFLGIEGTPAKQIATALDLGLHETDEVIRRRLLQRLETAEVESRIQSQRPSKQQLLDYYRQHGERWRQSEQFAFDHLFFSADKPAADERAEQALSALSALRPGSEPPVGDIFLMGKTMPLQTTAKLRNSFGSAFTDALEHLTNAEEPGERPEWLGPIPSTYGLHLIRIRQYIPSHIPAFGEIENKIQNALESELRGTARADFIRGLREKYTVVTP